MFRQALPTPNTTVLPGQLETTKDGGSRIRSGLIFGLRTPPASTQSRLSKLPSGRSDIKTCNGPQHDEALEKVALFCKAGVPTHASRQLNEVFWTSKLGQEIDISHDLEAISGKAYGEVSEILARAKPA